jgi:deazaflavin-dependent oxidoreductase (nitroreductase family)
VNPLTGAVRALGKQRWFVALSKGIVPADRALQRATRGRLSLTGASGLPHLLLTVTGARTGLPRQVPLIHAPDGDRYVVAGSNWGGPTHPAWTANLLAHPDATVNLRGREIPVRGRLVEGAERDRLWAVLTAVWPAYDGYAARAGRQIRVFALEPAQPS